MTQKTRKIFRRILLITLLLCFGYGFYYLFYDMSNLPQGIFISSVNSPNNEYTVKSYLYNGGATTGYAVRVELINNKTDKTKNIYWQYKIDKSEIVWLDNETVRINGIKLNIYKDRYDWRRHN